MASQIRIGGEMGGLECEPQIAYFHHILDLLDTYASKTYAPGVFMIACHFQMEGKMQSFGYEGLRLLRYYKKAKRPYMSVQIGVPRKLWNVEPTKVKATYSDFLRRAFRMFSEKAMKEGIEFDHENFLRDTELVLKHFLQQPTKPYRGIPAPVNREEVYNN